MFISFVKTLCFNTEGIFVTLTFNHSYYHGKHNTALSRAILLTFCARKILGQNRDNKQDLKSCHKTFYQKGQTAILKHRLSFFFFFLLWTILLWNNNDNTLAWISWCNIMKFMLMCCHYFRYCSFIMENKQNIYRQIKKRFRILFLSCRLSQCWEIIGIEWPHGKEGIMILYDGSDRKECFLCNNMDFHTYYSKK